MDVYTAISSLFFCVFHAENYVGIIRVDNFVYYLVDLLLPNILVTLIISIPFIVLIFVLNLIIRSFK